MTRKARGDCNTCASCSTVAPALSGDEYAGRVDAMVELMVKRGGFTEEFADEAIFSSKREHVDKIAVWLLDELDKLRELESSGIGAPVRRGETLGRASIAEIAMHLLLSSRRKTPGLVGLLLSRLLDLDRRHSLSEGGAKFYKAARLDAEARVRRASVGTRSLAKAVGTNPGTISKWRRKIAYERTIERHVQDVICSQIDAGSMSTAAVLEELRLSAPSLYTTIDLRARQELAVGK